MPAIINNGQHGAVYVMARTTQDQLNGLSYADVVNQVRDNPNEIGNYDLLPGKQAEIESNQWVVVAYERAIILDTQQMGNHDIKLWTD